jgi:hypothetical protein
VVVLACLSCALNSDPDGRTAAALALSTPPGADLVFQGAGDSLDQLAVGVDGAVYVAMELSDGDSRGVARLEAGTLQPIGRWNGPRRPTSHAPPPITGMAAGGAGAVWLVESFGDGPRVRLVAADGSSKQVPVPNAVGLPPIEGIASDGGDQAYILNQAGSLIDMVDGSGQGRRFAEPERPASAIGIDTKGSLHLLGKRRMGLQLSTVSPDGKVAVVLPPGGDRRVLEAPDVFHITPSDFTASPSATLTPASPTPGPPEPTESPRDPAVFPGTEDKTFSGMAVAVDGTVVVAFQVLREYPLWSPIDGLYQKGTTFDGKLLAVAPTGAPRSLPWTFVNAKLRSLAYAPDGKLWLLDDHARIFTVRF